MTESALVTGGSQGIGRAIAAELARAGFQVINLDREPPQVPCGVHVAVDLADRSATAAALAEVVGRYPVTRLVNNVGIVRPGPVEEQTAEDVEAVMDLNVRTAIQCAEALLPAMREAGFGRIVNISSRAALGKELRSAYAASKSALHGLTKTWALELGQFGITVNAVSPGPIATDLFRRVNPDNSPRTAAIRETIPMRRMGQPEDIAGAVAFFLRQDTSFVTGQVLHVCGGMTVAGVGG
ncbi:NAD(P)-dependent dehydrogenase (short-subunit alcohol dehydrogenase family) [Stella humosa]|uniref:NAD(P)-dependent dehydrogenase (Short-subunit alcohol dehydrogenase family) n=1 Tax=Stella humosa TaxID=94 RepID=A0A3N1M9U7_9PROT|nr:SDR family oxidoreductase [Stella humosa]ROQ00009.1 NAD(P)-dependent dehydrogenase (short-subunit alcohol dehydrogenase family) [Stella humosa]BBK30760.1 short-chain dehydrogenase [Stella humosa]